MSKKIHYAWYVMVAAFLMNLCVIGVASVGISIFLPALREKLSLTGTQSSFIMSLQGIATIAALGGAGNLYKKYSVRAVNLFFVFVCILGFILMGFANSILVLYIGAVLTGITLGGAGHVPTSTLINRWFIKSRGKAFGIVTIGSGVSSTLLTPAITWVIQHYSLVHGFMFASGVILVFEAIAFFIVRNYPEDMGLKPYGYEETDTVAGSEKKEVVGYTQKEALKMPSFWLLAFVAFLVGFTVKPAIGHIILYATSVGFEPMVAASAFSMYAFVNIFTKPLYGAIADKVGTYKSNWYIFLAYGIGLASAAFISRGAMFLYLFALLFAIGIPIGTMGNPFWTTDLFGNREYGAIYSYILAFYNVGIVLGSTFFGLMTDLTGTYLTGYMVCSAMMVVGLVIIQCLYQSRKKHPITSRG
ncbi:MAG: MFS transporter [Clostridium sp.]|nr:MFS transporter [Clostridium sp.]